MQVTLGRQNFSSGSEGVESNSGFDSLHIQFQITSNCSGTPTHFTAKCHYKFPLHLHFFIVSQTTITQQKLINQNMTNEAEVFMVHIHLSQQL